MLVYNTSTTSKRSIWPPEHSDKYVHAAEGSTLYLGEGPMDDWCSALGAVTLGYDAFSANLIQVTPAASLPWSIEQSFADQFCKAMDTEAVRFFKSGSDAVSCAVRLARAYTGKPGVLVFKECYHGTGDWFGPALWSTSGVTLDQPVHIAPFGKEFSYGYSPGYIMGRSFDIAAVVLEPVPKSILLPPEGWLEYVRGWCDEHGSILISDEVILGYRCSLQGYLEHAGVSADLRCYGKAMGQGSAISATCGRADIMELLKDRVHFSGTNNGEPIPLYIAQQTLQRYLAEDVCTQLSNKGALLRYLLHEAGFTTRGLDARFEVEFVDAEERMSATRALWDDGVLFPGFVSVSLAHKRDQMDRLIRGLKKWRG